MGKEGKREGRGGEERGREKRRKGRRGEEVDYLTLCEKLTFWLEHVLVFLPAKSR